MIRPLKTGSLPEFFRPLFWSYNFDSVDPVRHKKMIIINTLNYGDLRHWRWIADHYGRDAVKEILKEVGSSEIRARSGRLAEIIFNLKLSNDAHRGSDSGR